jgi:hypothetical protein
MAGGCLTIVRRNPVGVRTFPSHEVLAAAAQARSAYPPPIHGMHELLFRAGLPIPDAGVLIDKALKRAGRGGFSDLSFVEPLNLLLKSYAEEADLSVFGRYATRWDLERCLANLLRLDVAEEESPDILARPIRKPVFITGMPRSASSFLHMTLSLDPPTLCHAVGSSSIPIHLAAASRPWICATPGWACNSDCFTAWRPGSTGFII